MSLDACFLTFLTGQLNSRISGMRVEKIFMPSRDESVFVLRGKEKLRLLINASTNSGRISLTESETENPAVPPTFCMVLRKHFLGGRIIRAYMPEFERYMVIEFECKNDFFEPVKKSIVCELTGRSSNMILTDGDGRIIDAVRRCDLSGGRSILPSAKYEPMPKQEGKTDFISLVNISALLSNPEQSLDRAIMERVSGISPVNAREIAYICTGACDTRCGQLSADEQKKLEDTVLRIQDDIKTGRCAPTVVLKAENGRPVDFSFMPITQYGGYCVTETFDTPSQAVERFFFESSRKMRFEQKTRDLSQVITRLSSRVMRTMTVRRKELEDSKKAQQYRLYGELINANLYRLEKGMTKFEAENYYDGLSTVTVPLSPKLSPAENARAYFKKYTKAKNSAQILEKLIADDSRELSYLESVSLALSECDSIAEAQEIRSELIRQGYIRSRKASGRAPEKPGQPKTFEYGGYTILVGKNNTQNDIVTVKLSRKDDIWLHTKSVHSSHVLICARGSTPPDDVIEYAASLCAYYSRARNDKKVEVDYCPVQNVKKPAGAKPGMVVYDNYRSVTVQPLEVLQ